MTFIYFTLLTPRVSRCFEMGFCKLANFVGLMFIVVDGETSFQGFCFCFALLGRLVKGLGFVEIVLHFIATVF